MFSCCYDSMCKTQLQDDSQQHTFKMRQTGIVENQKYLSNVLLVKSYFSPETLHIMTFLNQLLILPQLPQYVQDSSQNPPFSQGGMGIDQNDKKGGLAIYCRRRGGGLRKRRMVQEGRLSNFSLISQIYSKTIFCYKKTVLLAESVILKTQMTQTYKLNLDPILFQMLYS